MGCAWYVSVGDVTFIVQLCMGHRWASLPWTSNADAPVQMHIILLLLCTVTALCAIFYYGAWPAAVVLHVATCMHTSYIMIYEVYASVF
jgi:hypothetical protein